MTRAAASHTDPLSGNAPGKRVRLEPTTDTQVPNASIATRLTERAGVGGRRGEHREQRDAEHRETRAGGRHCGAVYAVCVRCEVMLMV